MAQWPLESGESTVLENPSTLLAASFDVGSTQPTGPAPMLATGGFFDGTAQDNSTDKWEGASITFVVVAPASANGPVILSFKRSTDGGTTFDDDALAIEMDRISFTAAGTKRLSIQI